MGRTLVALYQDSPTAHSVVNALLEAGFSTDDIRIMVNDADQPVYTASTAQEITTSECASLGAVVGALVGIGSVLVPGIGPMLGIGTLSILVTAGIGAAAGALTGGIAAELIDVETDKTDLRPYSSGLQWKGTIVSLTTNEQWLEWAERIMMRYEPLKIEGREATWYGSARVAFSPDASESRRMQTLGAGSSTHLRQIGSSTSIRQHARIYNSPN
ncbi:MAG: hypothetical protein ABI835_02125 [Chloroflexota bacterium]